MGADAEGEGQEKSRCVGAQRLKFNADAIFILKGIIPLIASAVKQE